MSVGIKVLSFLIVTMIGIILSNHNVVCDVDPSDALSIILEQLKIQTLQFDIDNMILQQLAEQIRLQQDQLAALQRIEKRPVSDSPTWTVLISVACSALGFIVLELLKVLHQYLYTRYQNPEMPQTSLELIDFARPSTSEHLRSVPTKKSPADYFSCESSDE